MVDAIGCLRRIWLGWVSCSLFSYIKSIATLEKIFAVEKSGPNAAFNLFFLGLGWPWVGGLVGFIVIFLCFPTEQNLVNRKHPIGCLLILIGWLAVC